MTKSNRCYRRWLPPAIFFVMCISLKTAFAQPAEAETCPAPPEDDAAAKELAGRWFSRGTEHANAEAYLEAEASFRCSYAIVPHPATLLNLAKAAKLAGRTEAAADAYREYIERYPDEQKIEIARAVLEHLAKTMQESDSKTGDDSASTEPPPETPVEQEPPLLQPAEALAFAPMSENDADVGPDLNRAPYNGRLRTPAIATLITGSAVLAVGVGLGAASLYQYGQRNGVYWLDDLNTIEKKYRSYGQASVATLTVGGALIVTGVTLFTRHSLRQNEYAKRIGIGIAKKQLALSLTF